MRHLIGLILALAMAAALFFAATWGYLRVTTLAGHLSRLPGGGGPLLTDPGARGALIALAGTGLLAGILVAAPRISPLAAGLPGLALLGLTALYLVSIRRAAGLIPLQSHTSGTGFEAMLASGLLGAAGLAMIIPLFVPSRWRSRRAVAEPAAYEIAPDAYAADPGATQTMASNGLLSDWAETRPQPRVEPGASQAPWGPAEPGNAGGTSDYN